MVARIQEPLAERTVQTVRRTRYTSIKRGLDISGALVLLLLSAPLFLAIAVIVHFTSPGPVFFRQTRVGLQGREFQILKFRSMFVAARLTATEQAAFKSEFKLEQDRRVTPVGRVLRKTSLDELPQFVNVLLGHMSLVGPRPVVPEELYDKYGEAAERLLSVRPGMTGLWQVSGRSSLSYDERIRLDLAYVDTNGLLVDLVLLARTPVAVLTARGAR